MATSLFMVYYSKVEKFLEDDIKDMMAKLPMSITNVNNLNELLKLQMSEAVEGMDLYSALFKIVFTPKKDKSIF